MSSSQPIDLDSDDDDTEVETAAVPATRAGGKRSARDFALPSKSESIDLTDESEPVAMPSRKARKPDGDESGSPRVVIDLLGDDDGQLPAGDDEDVDFARQFQQAFDDEVEIVGEKWVTAAPPTSRPTRSSGAGASSSSAAASTSGASSSTADVPSTEGDEDFAARLQAQVDDEARRAGERRDRLADADEEFARTLQARMNKEIADSGKQAAQDILHNQRNQIRSWLASQAALLNVKDVSANPAAMPDGNLYQKFKAAHAAAKDKSIRLVFHGTQEANIEAICRDGLNPGKRGVHGQAHGAGEYFAETPTISMPYCQGGRKMIVFAVLMDQSGLTKRAGGIVVVNKTEHQLPMFVITFEATAQSHAYAAAGLPGMGSFGGSGTAAQRLAQLRQMLAAGGYGGAVPPPPVYKPPPPRARAAPAKSRGRKSRKR